MILKLMGLKSCRIADMQIEVVRDQEFDCPDNIAVLLLAQDGRFVEIKKKNKKEKEA